MSENAELVLEVMNSEVQNGKSTTGSFNFDDLIGLINLSESALKSAIIELSKLGKVSVLHSDNKPILISLTNRCFGVRFR